MKPSHIKILAALEELGGKEASKDYFVNTTGLSQRKIRVALNALASEGKCVVAFRVRSGYKRLVVNPADALTDTVQEEHEPRHSIPFDVVPNIDKLIRAGFQYSKISRAFRSVGFDIKPSTIRDAADRVGAYANVPRGFQ